jgi:RimJ/RimL family protein N-acetyltransferase
VQPPTLGGAGVVVRGLRPDDDVLARLGSDPLVRRWLPGITEATGGDTDGTDGTDGLTLAVDVAGRCCGAVRLRTDGAAGGELDVALLPEARGRGAAATAVRLLLEWAFVELGLQAVHWRAEAGNWPGRRLAWACGSSVEGTVRDLLVRDGDRRDAWVGTLRWDELPHPRRRWLVPVTLCGEGVRLGPHAPEDVERIAEACAAPSTQAWLPGLPAPYTVLDAASYVSSREEQHATASGVYWAVRGADGGALLAEVGVFRLEDGSPSGEVGYWCHPDARGRGVMTGAVRLVSRHALTPTRAGGLGLERLLLRVARGNIASRRVAQKAGYTEVGVDRAAERLRDGTAVDFLRYDLLASEVTCVTGEAARQVGSHAGPGLSGA